MTTGDRISYRTGQRRRLRSATVQQMSDCRRYITVKKVRAESLMAVSDVVTVQPAKAKTAKTNQLKLI